MNLAKPIKMCLNETYSRVWVSRHLSDVSCQNGLKQGAASLPVSFDFAVEYAFQRVQVNQDGLKLNVIHQLLVYADDVNTLGGNIHMTKKNTEALLDGSWETSLDQVLLEQDHDDMEYMARKLKEEYEKWGLAINLEKTKYVCMGEGKETLKFDGGEEIKPCTECTYLGTKIDQWGDNTTEIKHRIN